jgi:CPA2 family monovalent cation:H+ antiporter-2
MIGYQIGRMFHWSSMDSLFLGAILSISSTTIIVKALGDLGQRQGALRRADFWRPDRRGHPGHRDDRLLSGIAMTQTLAIALVVTTLLKWSFFPGGRASSAC